ncbi:WGR domain-containing protein [Donghicola sp. XS_ASV15]|uniref:WGR domain-containing protein n=1 Tax=Donghicola sp. XS_ASV15 TaxID=3241295 RepID=UPI003519CC61
MQIRQVHIGIRKSEQRISRQINRTGAYRSSPVPPIWYSAVHIRLEKVNHIRRQRRYCVISSGQTLFGEWFVQRETGRIGSQGAQQSVEYVSSWQEAYEAIEQMKRETCRKGYAPIPVQLHLF